MGYGILLRLGAIFAALLALWYVVGMVEDSIRLDERTKVEATYRAKAEKAATQITDLTAQRAKADLDAQAAQMEIADLRKKEATNEIKYRNDVLTALRNRMRNSTDGSVNGMPSVSAASTCLDFASRAFEAAERNYQTSERNADRVDQILARIEIDRAAYYTTRGEKDPSPSTSAQERVAATRKLLSSKGKELLLTE